jgi:para-nitrobenzyl esterase
MGSIVRTRSGRIEGGDKRGVEVYRGVPFAQPPVGALRFRAPEPPIPWQNVRRATDYGPSAPQIGPVNRFIRTMIGATGRTQSQDCLYLNVWTPKADGKRRPVMVWLHGGAFILGSGSTPLYAGWRMARRGDVVVVTINYRLGVHGFLSGRSLARGAEHPPENLGIRDQIAALEWVRDNIDAFGGDPENVTIFGESAGGMSVGTLLGAPAARGLFHKAILQSGAAHNVWTAEQADRVTEAFVEALGRPEITWDEITRLPVTELMGAQVRVSARLGLQGGVLAWQPALDGDLLPTLPLQAVQAGNAAEVPMLIGTNRDEWKLFMIGDPGARGMSNEDLSARIARALRACPDGGETLRVEAANAYWHVHGPSGGEPAERWSAFMSDRIFHYPAVRLADLHSARQPAVYAYSFDWTPPATAGLVGACHGLEIPFVFGSLRAAWMRTWLGASPRAQRLCDRMQDAWIAFARSGDPGHERLPHWPAYSELDRSTMVFDGECTLREDPHARARSFWELATPWAQLPVPAMTTSAPASSEAV